MSIGTAAREFAPMRPIYERGTNMKTRKWVGIVVVAVLMTMADRTWGQRGMGDNEGVVRQAIETQRISIEGTVKDGEALLLVGQVPKIHSPKAQAADHET